MNDVHYTNISQPQRLLHGNT